MATAKTVKDVSITHHTNPSNIHHSSPPTCTTTSPPRAHRILNPVTPCTYQITAFSPELSFNKNSQLSSVNTWLWRFATKFTVSDLMVREVDLWKRASRLRKKQRWTAAISNYSQAIELSSKEPFLWVGRAICYHGLKDWNKVKIDCTKALELKPDDPKAHFYYGVALVWTNDVDEGIKYMEKALDLANCQHLKAKANFVEEVNQELVHAKYLKGQKSCAETLLELQTLKEACVCALKEKNERAHSETECDLSKQLSRLDEVFDKAFRTVTPNGNEVPYYLRCQITRDIMRDPVITPGGVTYDRSALVSFLRERGTDPLTRAPLNERQLVPNRGIKEAVAEFFKENMWAYKHY